MEKIIIFIGILCVLLIIFSVIIYVKYNKLLKSCKNCGTHDNKEDIFGVSSSTLNDPTKNISPGMIGISIIKKLPIKFPDKYGDIIPLVDIKTSTLSKGDINKQLPWYAINIRSDGVQNLLVPTTDNNYQVIDWNDSARAYTLSDDKKNSHINISSNYDRTRSKG